MSVEITGLEQIEEGVQQQIKQYEKHQDVMLRAGQEVLEHAIKRDLPTSDRDGAHISENIVSSGPVTEGGRRIIKTGWGEDTRWRVHFVEFGTMFQPAQGTITKAMQASRMEMYQAMLAVGRMMG